MTQTEVKKIGENRGLSESGCWVNDNFFVGLITMDYNKFRL